MKKDVAIGTIRVEAKTLKVFENTKKGLKQIKREFPELQAVVKSFKAHKKFNTLVEGRWLKGQLSSSGMVQGARVVIMPDGQVLNKAYSLFSPHLKLHDQDSHDHWDVMYQNKGGTWNYGYTQEKIKLHKNSKFKKVHQFDKVYTLLCSNVMKGLRDSKDSLALPMLTLLRTNMRVGNEIYYKTHGHKGLTTLLKKDVSVKGNTVTFSYIGKDGVPQVKTATFPATYVTRLKSGLNKLKSKDFVFGHKGRPLPEREFKKAFLGYCGHEFYPHIVRSHYATSKVEQFLKGKKRVSKEEATSLYLGIASALGHKKFSKKKGVWEESYTVTIGHYIQPSLVEKVSRLVK